jgi:hypothetical protein
MVQGRPMNQDTSVRLYTSLFALAAGSLVGCGHNSDEMMGARSPDAYSGASSTAPASASVASERREVIAVDSARPAEPEPPTTRPRLSQTVTLGQGTEWQYTPGGAPPRPAAPGPGPVVINNNNTVVVGGAGYGYGGYVGYGGYAGRGYGRPTTFYGEAGGRGNPQWGSTGWEGARRTAAPGQTPGVGGNWAPAPSYGPATMK